MLFYFYFLLKNLKVVQRPEWGSREAGALKLSPAGQGHEVARRMSITSFHFVYTFSSRTLAALFCAWFVQQASYRSAHKPVKKEHNDRREYRRAPPKDRESSALMWQTWKKKKRRVEQTLFFIHFPFIVLPFSPFPTPEPPPLPRKIDFFPFRGGHIPTSFTCPASSAKGEKCSPSHYGSASWHHLACFSVSLDGKR